MRNSLEKLSIHLDGVHVQTVDGDHVGRVIARLAIHPGEGSLLREVEVLAPNWHFLGRVVDTGQDRLNVVRVVKALHVDDSTSRSGV